MVKRIFKYLKGTRENGLMHKGKNNEMVSYSDVSFTNCKGSLTTSGYLIQIYRDSIGSKTHRQSSVAISTCQTEYVALSKACQELMSVHNSFDTVLEGSKMLMTV